MWKNCTADIQGLYHYRRFISGIDTPNASEQVVISQRGRILANSITEQKILDALSGAAVILCFPYSPYPLDSLEDLRRFVYLKDIKAMCEFMRENYPDYMPSLNHILGSEHMSYCNMFIARREFVNDYCSWLFDILGRLEGRISLEGYDTQHKRIYGYLAEVLLNVYIHRHNLRCKYFHIIQLYEKDFLHYLLSCAKKTVKKIPGLRHLIYALRTWSTEGRNESMQEFLSGGKKHYGRKITDASNLTDYLSFYGIKNTKCIETDSLIYAYVDMHYPENNVAIAVFIAKDGADSRKIPSEIQSVIREKESSNVGIVVMPRFIPNDETPDSLKATLIESGCRILEEV